MSIPFGSPPVYPLAGAEGHCARDNLGNFEARVAEAEIVCLLVRWFKKDNGAQVIRESSKKKLPDRWHCCFYYHHNI